MYEKNNSLLDIFSNEDFVKESLYYREGNNGHGQGVVVFNKAEWLIGNFIPEEKINNNCQCFIDEYFKQGAKYPILKPRFKDEFIDKSRAVHTVSLFFLGYYLRDIVDLFLRKQYCELIGKNNTFWFDFRYTWFLAALFHDYAFSYECISKQKKIVLDDIERELECFLQREFELKNDVFDHNFLRETQVTSRLIYTKETIRKYFTYRVENCECWDHGIVGGFLLFDRLVENYNNAWRGYQRSTKYARGNNKDTYELFSWENLEWRREHLDHFALISHSIIAHNIWRGMERDEKLYSQYGLDNLVGNSYKKIDLKTQPLTFFLCLLDSIEPIKQIRKIIKKLCKNDRCSITTGYHSILQGVSIGFNSNNTEICIESRLDDKITKEYFNSIKELSSWLNVMVVSDERVCRIIIQ